MKIETKFNVGQKVYYLKGVNLKVDTIHSIDVEITLNKTEIRYCFREEKKGFADFKFANESKVFASKEDFLNQLETENE